MRARPSYRIKKGDVIGFAKGKADKTPIKTALEAMQGKTLPSWLAFDADTKQGTVQALPTRDEITLPIQEQLIVELYSR